jgi:hypothetical protein
MSSTGHRSKSSTYRNPQKYATRKNKGKTRKTNEEIKQESSRGSQEKE